MKSLNVVALSLLTLVCPSFGALYTLNNGTGTSASGIQTMSGDTFRGSTLPGASLGGTNGGISAGPGVIAIGIFSTDNLASLADTTSLLAAFTQFGAAGAFSGGSTTGQRSIFSLPTSGTVKDSVFENKPIYLLVGNGTALSGSSEFLVVKTTTMFTAAQDLLPTALTVTVRPSDVGSSLLLGSVVPDVKTTNSDATATQGWKMTTLVPETSTALLGALGALGLLRRRR